MFKVVKTENSTSRPLVYKLMTDNEAAVAGSIYGETSGRMTLSGLDSDTPNQNYLCLKSQAAEASSVTLVPFMLITEDMQLETTSTATVAATVKGSKVTLASGAATVTATTTKGVFYIDETDGATTNSTVRGKFRR